MKILTLICLFSVFICGETLFAADFDVLTTKTVAIPGGNVSGALSEVLADVPAVLRSYVPLLDSGSTLVTPAQVSGSANHPVLTMTVKKCVFFVCETVDFAGEISIQEVPGKCQRNIVIETDLARSGDNLRNVYDRFELNVCLLKVSDTQSSLQISSQAHHASSYSSGVVQKAIFDFLVLQMGPLTEVFQKALIANSAKVANL